MVEEYLCESLIVEQVPTTTGGGGLILLTDDMRQQYYSDGILRLKDRHYCALLQANMLCVPTPSSTLSSLATIPCNDLLVPLPLPSEAEGLTITEEKFITALRSIHSQALAMAVPDTVWNNQVHSAERKETTEDPTRPILSSAHVSCEPWGITILGRQLSVGYKYSLSPTQCAYSGASKHIDV